MGRRPGAPRAGAAPVEAEAAAEAASAPEQAGDASAEVPKPPTPPVVRRSVVAAVPVGAAVTSGPSAGTRRAWPAGNERRPPAPEGGCDAQSGQVAGCRSFFRSLWVRPIRVIRVRFFAAAHAVFIWWTMRSAKSDDAAPAFSP